jgi:hypothetical protein
MSGIWKSGGRPVLQGDSETNKDDGGGGGFYCLRLCSIVANLLVPPLA